MIDHGRKQRLFTGAARRAAKLLIRRCGHPGCAVPSRFAQVDHAEEWCHGGTTDQSNAAIECGTHNRLKHRHRWRTEADDRGTRFAVRPDGTMVLPAGARPPAIPSEDARLARQRLHRFLAERAA